MIIQKNISYRYNDKMIDPIISAIWADMGQRQSDISISIFYETMYKAENTNTMYNLVNTLLLNSMPYNREILKPDDSVVICGPPVLMISDKQHTIFIKPVYYLTKDGNVNDLPEAIHAYLRSDGFIQSDDFIRPKTDFDVYKIKFISGVLMVNLDDSNVRYIQNQTFYNWLNDKQWQSFFNLD